MSAPDLVEIAAVLGINKRSAERMASREGWKFEENAVRGGKKRYYPLATLPAEIRRKVISSRSTALVSSGAVTSAAPLPVAAATAAGFPTPCVDLTDAQRHQRDARAGVIAAINRLMAETGCSKESAMTTLLNSARSGMAAPIIESMLRLACDARGRGGDGYPSIRTLKRWLAAPDLAPKLPQADMAPPAWAKSFLAVYQQPQKMSVRSAYREWAKTQPEADLPSYDAVNRFLNKLGAVTRNRGRLGARELKTIKPFVRRDTSELLPNDVWTADGHTFDAEVQHPIHGRPFRPEITTIIDVATRRAVGWSVDLAESSLAVLDALRNGVERCGIPAIFYVDHGSGYDNAMMKDEATGLLGRLGTTVKHSLPYNSQARGVIERSHQTIWVQAARQLPSYVGALMDREARLAQFKVTRQTLKHGGTMPLMPWDVFVRFAEEKVAEYNSRVHRALKGTSPDLQWHAFESKGWQAERLNADHNETLFRPRVVRTIQRGEINLFTNIYFSRLLAEFHGMQAAVAYDIRDAQKVWVYMPDGRFICTAEFNGNRTSYFPVSAVEQAREKRAQGRLNRVDAKRTEILEELHGRTIAAPAAGHVVIGGRVIDGLELAAEPLAIEADEQAAIATPIETEAPTPARAKDRSSVSAEENFADWQEIDGRILAGEYVSEAEAFWHESYQRTPQYKAMAGKRKAVA